MADIKRLVGVETDATNGLMAAGSPVEIVVRIIESSRLDLSDEKRLQAQLADVFKEAGIVFEREFRLSVGDVPDFFVEGGIVVECKTRGARKTEVYRQLVRYAEHENVNAIVLASNLSMGLPADIGGKPAYMASLSRGWM